MRKEQHGIRGNSDLMCEHGKEQHGDRDSSE
jgi:hypothetical protein